MASKCGKDHVLNLEVLLESLKGDDGQPDPESVADFAATAIRLRPYLSDRENLRVANFLHELGHTEDPYPNMTEPVLWK